MAGYILYSLDADKFQQFLTQPTPDQLAQLGQSLADGLEEYGGEDDEATDPLLACPPRPKALTKFAAERLPQADWYSDLTERGKIIWEGALFHLGTNDDSDLDFRVEHDGFYWDVVELAWKYLGVPANGITSVAFSTFGKKPYGYHPPQTAGSTFSELDRAEKENRSSLQAMSNVLEEMIQDMREGRRDPDEVLDMVLKTEEISPEHKNTLRDILDEVEEDENDEVINPWHSMHSMHTSEETQQMVVELRSIAAPMRAGKDNDIRQQFEEMLATLEKVASEGRMLFVQVDT